ncbi:Clavesin-1 [Microtus ochrogaster]|uniref:Clavesin-1 n=1 Tax=Microtus ochrogaster TaxID=79684 RepID=A0A8J6GV57_MICOH|nr:Clavesin-1 [Microtus ochrogaster]
MTDISRIPGTPKAISTPCVLCLQPAVPSPDCEIRLNSALLLKEVNHVHCNYEGNPQQGVPNTTQDVRGGFLALSTADRHLVVNAHFGTSPMLQELLVASAGSQPPSLQLQNNADSFPARFGGVHFVNQPWYIHALYTLIKPFLKDKTRKRIFLHGNNLNSLHQLIHPEFLPSEFGGTLPPYDMGTWARTLLGPDYSDENDYTHTSYKAMHVKHTCSNLERECSPKPMKRSQSVVEAGTLKHDEKGENENTQPLLALD